MTTLKLTLCSGYENTFEYAGTRQEYIDEMYGVGGLNPAYGALTDVTPVAAGADVPTPKKKAVKSDVVEQPTE